MGDGAKACEEGSGSLVAVLYLDLIVIELPRIVCALNGLIRCISSLSNSAVDLTLGREEVLDRNEGGPVDEDCASLMTLLIVLPLCVGGTIDR